MGTGPIDYGNCSVVDLGGRAFFDSARHRLDLHLNNALNKTYATAPAFGVADVTGDPYMVQDRGLPRTLGATYTYSF